jgi:hypothetical protein
MAHSTVDFDESLKDAAKMIGGHGIINQICNEALREFVYRTGDPNVLPLAARQAIQLIREQIETAANEERIIHDCWEDLVKARFAPIIGRYGMKKIKLESIVEEAKLWIWEKYGILPTDDEITTRFKYYYIGEREYWQKVRGDVFCIGLKRDERLRDHCHEMGKQITANTNAYIEATNHE